MPRKTAVLVTGAAGFIGFHTCKLLLSKGITVVGFDNLNDYYSVALKTDRLKEMGVLADGVNPHQLLASSANTFHFFKGDLNDDQTWSMLQTEFTVTAVIHLAAQAGVRHSLTNPEAYVESNVSGFLKVLEFLKRIGLKKLIYASSSSVYGMSASQPFSESERCDKPVSLYAATKRANELMAQTYHHLFGIESIGLRFFTVYGPWGRPDMAPFIFAKAALEGKPIKVFNNGEQARDFTFVDDIVNGVYQVYKQQDKIKGAQICNIGNGKPVPLMEFIAAIEQACETTLQKEMLPAQPGDVVVTYADTTALQTQFAVNVHTPINDGVKHFFNWYAAYYKQTSSQV